MKCVLSLLFAVGLAVSVHGGTSTNGSSATLKGIEIVWTAPTNDWPKKLWVYKVIPQELSEVVMSNLLAIGSFAAKDRTKISDYIDSKDEVIFYGDPDGKMRHLAICPALGFIEYHDGKAKSLSQLEPIAGVPDQNGATQLGLKYLRLFGIDVSEIVTKPGTGDLNLHWERQTLEYDDPKTKVELTLTNAYGVFFLRRIDGIDVVGIGLNGGAYMSFGNGGKPVDLQISWRNLKPWQLNACPSPLQINEQIKNGKIALHPFGSKAVFAEPIEKLTITKAMTLYSGKHYDERMDFVTPFARFEGTALDGTNTTSLWFESQMTFNN